jgi:RimJ/RimL family protein N-acetyltransferase
MPEIPLPEPPLEDGVVRLRPFEPGDADAITAICQDSEIARWTRVPSPYTDADAEDFLAGVEERRRRGDELGLAVVDVASGALVGSCGLPRIDWEDRRAEIGYLVAAEERGRSVATRAVRLLARWAMGTLGLERMEILAHPDNEPSQLVALSAGFRREGLLRSYHLRKGQREDRVVFALLRGEFVD